MKIEIRPYSVGDLAVYYNVDRRTFKTWIIEHEAAIGKRVGYYYTIKQVKIIFTVLGVPGDFLEIS